MSEPGLQSMFKQDNQIYVYNLFYDAAFDANDVDTRTKAAVEVENDYWYDSGSFYEVYFHSQ